MKREKTALYIIHCSVTIALLIISTFIRIPFPIIPITMQTFVVILCALYLGPKKTTISIFVYIMIGLIGFPVFTSGGGIGYVIKPTFGYMLGMLPAAYIAGNIIKRSKKKTYLTYLIASMEATLIIYCVGVPYLYVISNYVLHINREIGQILYSGFLLTLPGDIVKCIVASLAAKRLPPLSKY